MNDKVIAAIEIDPKDLHLEDDIQSLKHIQRHHDSAKRLISSLVNQNGGHVVGEIHGHLIIEVPVHNIEVIKEINSRLQDEMKLMASIGVGEDSREAMIALDFAINKHPGQIKVYKAEMEEPVQTEPKELSVAVGESDQPIKKSENFVSISEEEKLKVAQLISEVQENKEVFDKLKEQAPEIYAGVIVTIQSLRDILLSDKQEKEQMVAKMIEQVNKQLEQHHKKNREKHGKQIQKELDKQIKEKNSENDEKYRQLTKIAQKEYSERRKKAIEYGKSVGHPNPIFFHYLMQELRRK